MCGESGWIHGIDLSIIYNSDYSWYNVPNFKSINIALLVTHLLSLKMTYTISISSFFASGNELPKRHKRVLYLCVCDFLYIIYKSAMQHNKMLELPKWNINKCLS